MKKGLEKILSIFDTRRYFRVVIFRCPNVKSIADAAELVGVKKTTSIRWQAADGEFTSVHGAKVEVHSKEFYLRTTDPIERRKHLVNPRGSTYRYDIAILCISTPKVKDTVPTFLIAVPYAGLASEVFTALEDNRPNTALEYYRPNMSALLDFLEHAGRKKGILTTAVSWLVAGEGELSQLTCRGSNIFNSPVYAAHFSDKQMFDKHGQRFSLRRIQIRFENMRDEEPGPVKVTFDRSGQSVVWVGDGPKNLRILFMLFRELDGASVMSWSPRPPHLVSEDESLV